MKKNTIELGKKYVHRNGFIYQCVGFEDTGSPAFRELHNDPQCNDYWTFLAHNVQFDENGRISWDWSYGGRWVDNGDSYFDSDDHITDDNDDYDNRDYRDEWDDYWAGAARSVGAVPF